MAAQKEMSFLDHLEELRWHIIRALGAVMIAATAAFLAKDFIFESLIFGPTTFIPFAPCEELDSAKKQCNHCSANGAIIYG